MIHEIYGDVLSLAAVWRFHGSGRTGRPPGHPKGAAPIGDADRREAGRRTHQECVTALRLRRPETVLVVAEKMRSRPVSRVLSELALRDSHSSGTAVTHSLKQPTREQRGPRYRSPIWSCTGWGLPCRPCCHVRGGLLPVPRESGTPPCSRTGHRFTLA